jgi:hypothetical protein
VHYRANPNSKILFTSGVSSLQLSKELGITQKSAWFLLQRIREACSNDNNTKLTGTIEVDETMFISINRGIFFYVVINSRQ